MEIINITEARNRFSELVRRAAEGERFVTRRRGKPMAALIGADELEHLERSVHAARNLALALGQDQSILDKIERGELHPAMVAYGLWKDEPDLASLAEEIIKNRHRDSRSNSDPFSSIE